MSDNEKWRGKLTPINITDLLHICTEAMVKRFPDINPLDIYSTLYSATKDKVLFRDNSIFLREDGQEYEDEEYYTHWNVDKESKIITYTTKFYNGGTNITEELNRIIDEVSKGKTSDKE